MLVGSRSADVVEQDAEPVGRLPADRQVAADRVVLDRPGNPRTSAGQRDVPFTVIPFSRTVAASVTVTFRLTVMVECPSGSTMHSCAEFSVNDGGWQPKPTNEPAAPVTLRPTVIVDGALCASSVAPAATFTLPTTRIAASAATVHVPVTLMLA